MRRVIVAALTAALLLAASGSAVAGPGGKDEKCPPTSNNPEGTPPDCGNQTPTKTAEKAVDGAVVTVNAAMDEAQAVLTQTVLTLVSGSAVQLDSTQQTVTYAFGADSYLEQQTMSVIDGGQSEVAFILPPLPPVCGGCVPEVDALYQTLYVAYYEATTSGIDGGQSEVAFILPPLPPVCGGCVPIIDSAFDSLQSELTATTTTTLDAFNATLDAVQAQL